jgi:hypothetical protein
VSRAGHDGADQVVLDGGVDGGLAVGDPLECFADLPGAGVFGQVPPGAGAQCVDDGAVIGIGGEHEHLDARVMFAEAAGGLDPVAVRHPEIHQHDVRTQLDRQRERLVAVGCGADDLDAGEQPEEGGESLADHALVIGHKDADFPAHAGTHSSTRNPPPVGPAVSVPPSSAARSLMPVSP